MSGLHGNGRAQTVQHLRYKAHLEAALNQALESL
jgi:adenylate cyclase class 1